MGEWLGLQDSTKKSSTHARKAVDGKDSNGDIAHAGLKRRKQRMRVEGVHIVCLHALVASDSPSRSIHV